MIVILLKRCKAITFENITNQAGYKLNFLSHLHIF